MKKLLLGLMLTSFLAVSPVLAQGFSYPKAYQDYLYNYSLYLTAHDNYVLRRANFLQYKTLVSEEEAKSATLAMLESRDETVKTLLTAIRMRIKENNGIPDAKKESLFSRLDPEVGFYEDHRVKLGSAATLSDLVKDSDLAKERFESSTELLIYTALVNISTGKVNGERDLVEKVIPDLKAKISEIKTTGDKDMSFVDKYFVDLENKLARGRDKEAEAETSIALAEKSYRDRVDYFNDAIAAVQGSYVYLEEVVTKLEEIIRLIKIN